MTPLDQARESGYSDEEIIQYISDNTPGWSEKYINAKKLGFSDSEILVERQRRKSEAIEAEQAQPIEQEQQQIPQDIQDPIDEQVVQEGIEPIQQGEVEPTEEKISPFIGAKSGLSALTLGLSEQVPGLSLSEKEKESLSRSDKVFSFLMKFFPVEAGVKMIANPITKKTAQWAAASPVGRKALTSLGKLAGIGATGAVLDGAEDAFKGELPSIEKMAEQGALWVALDTALSATGFIGRFGKALISKSKQVNKPSAKVLRETVDGLLEKGIDFSDNEKTAAAALDILEDIGKPRSKKVTAEELRNKKIDVKKIDEIVEGSSKLSEPLPEKVNVQEILESKEKLVSEKALDSISPRAETELELGTSIKNGIDLEIQKARDGYSPLYDFAEETAQGIVESAEKPIATARAIKSDLLKLKTKPTGYQTVLNTLETVLQDLGVITLPENKIVGEGFQVVEKVLVSKKMELKRRLNQIIDYDVLDWKVKQKLKPLVRDLGEDIRGNLKAASEEAFSSWTTAEEAYGDSARKFSNENIRKIRLQGKPEKLAKDISSPTVLKELKKALPKDVYAQTERELLEQIQSSNPKDATKKIRELSKSLSEDANKVAQDIRAAKDPLSPKVRRSNIQKSVLEDLATSIEKGQRPKEILDLWKTERGQKIVLESLKGSPNKAEVVNYLNAQSLNDVIKTVLNKENAFDFAKINRLVRDKDSRKMLSRIAGPEGVKFFEQLEQRSKQLEKNLLLQSGVKEGKGVFEKGVVKKGVAPHGENVLARKKVKNTPLDTFIENTLKDLGITSAIKLKHVLYGIGILSTPFAPKTVGSFIVAKALFRLAKKPAARKAFKEASSKGISNRAMANSINALVKALEEEE